MKQNQGIVKRLVRLTSRREPLFICNSVGDFALQNQDSTSVLPLVEPTRTHSLSLSFLAVFGATLLLDI